VQYFTVVNRSGKTIQIEDHVVPTGTAVVVTTTPDLVDLVEGVDIYIVVNQVGSQVSVPRASTNSRKSFTRATDAAVPPVVPKKPVNIADILGSIAGAEASISAEVAEVSAPSAEKMKERLSRKQNMGIEDL